MSETETLPEFGDYDVLSVAQLRLLAEEEAQALLGMSAEEAWAAIDREDERVIGTIAEVELKNLRWLIGANEPDSNQAERTRGVLLVSG